jgi:hypothetical protein
MPVNKFGGGRGRKLVRALLAGEAKGWAVATTNGNHLRLTSPAGHVVHLAGTPSDRKALQNNRALLRRISRQTSQS